MSQRSSPSPTLTRRSPSISPQPQATMNADSSEQNSTANNTSTTAPLTPASTNHLSAMSNSLRARLQRGSALKRKQVLLSSAATSSPAASKQTRKAVSITSHDTADEQCNAQHNESKENDDMDTTAAGNNGSRATLTTPVTHPFSYTTPKPIKKRVSLLSAKTKSQTATPSGVNAMTVSHATLSILLSRLPKLTGCDVLCCFAV